MATQQQRLGNVTWVRVRAVEYTHDAVSCLRINTRRTTAPESATNYSQRLKSHKTAECLLCPLSTPLRVHEDPDAGFLLNDTERVDLSQRYHNRTKSS